MSSGRAAAVIAAAGRGARLGGDRPKQFLDLGGRPLLAWSVEAFRAHPEIDEVVTVLPPDRAAAPPDWLASSRVVAGGATRAESVRLGLAALGEGVDTVLVHDGARPFVSGELIERVLRAARRGPVVPVVPVTDTIKRVRADGMVAESIPRSELRAAQTPQGFPRLVLERAHAGTADPRGATDDALLCERLGLPVRTVEGEADNFKVTTAEDLKRARALARRLAETVPGGGP